MRTRLLASLGSKLAIGVAATTLAAGSAGAVALQTISDDKPDTPDVEQVHLTNAPDQDDDVTARHAEADDEQGSDDADEAKDADEQHDDADQHGAAEHPDNFGAQVSEKARSGELTGEWVSSNAPGAEHRADHEDHADAAGDHRQDGPHVAESHKSDHHGDDSDDDTEDAETDSDS